MVADARQVRSPARVLLVLDQPVLAEVVKLTLNHGAYITEVATTAAAAVTMLHDWQPHLAVVDLDIDQGIRKPTRLLANHVEMALTSSAVLPCRPSSLSRRASRAR